MKTRENPDSNEMPSDLEVCAKDIIDAIQSSNHKKLAEALQSAFAICDSQPHEEGHHTNEQEEA